MNPFERPLFDLAPNLRALILSTANASVTGRKAFRTERPSQNLGRRDMPVHQVARRFVRRA